MKVALLSDSHGHWQEDWEKWLGDCDEIWHAGDFGSLRVAQELARWAPVVGVYGNIDGPEIRREFPLHQRFQRAGIEIWMTHIGGSPSRYPATISRQLRENPPDLFLCGHSHLVRAERDRHGVFHLNPGACGRQGEHQVRTFIRLQLEHRKVAQVRVLDLGPR